VSNPDNQHDDHNGDASEKRGIVAWFAGNHVAANIVMLFFILGGLLSLSVMRAETFPTVDPRMITVTVPFPAATPSEVEDGITSRVEEAVMGLEGVDRVVSTAQENAGTINIELEDFANASDVLDDVETEVDRLSDFPPENAEEPVIVKQKPTPQVMKLGLYGDVSEKNLKYWAERIENGLLQQPGISIINMSGIRDYEIAIEVNEDTLRKHNLSLADIRARVERASVNLPAGTLESKSGDILLRVEEKGYYADDFRDITIRSNADGSLLHLGEIAHINDGFEDINLKTLYNGERGVFISVSRSQAQDTLKMSQAVRDYLEKLELPKGIKVQIWEDETDILKSRINLLVRNGILGYALVFLALLLFIDLKLAFWTSMGVPISFLGGLLITFMLGMSINMVTLFALIVALGIVVDDAIVAGESIFHEQQKGKRNLRAALDGVAAVRAPVIIGVLTTIAAFAPLGFATGTLGQILQHIPVMVICILLVSLLEAFLILPAHLSTSTRWSAGIVRSVGKSFSHLLDVITDYGIEPLLRFCLRWRWAVLTLFFTFLIITYGMVKGGIVKFVFFPQIEGNTITANLIMPIGTPYSVTEKHANTLLEAAKATRAHYKKTTGQDLYRATALTIGAISSPGGAPMQTDSSSTGNHRAQLKIQLIDAAQRDITAKALTDSIRERVGEIPNAEEISYQSSIVHGGADITWELRHNEVDTLNAAANDLKSRMDRINGVVDIADSLKLGKREFVFDVTQAGAAAGLQPGDIGRQLRSGYYGTEVQRIQRARNEIKVLVRYPESSRESLAELGNRRITLPNGERAPLHTVANIREKRNFATIRRVNGQRTASVTADTNPAEITPNAAINTLKETAIPELKRKYPGLGAEIEGESADRREDLAQLGRNMLIAMMVIFVMLGALLRSYIQPIVILMAVPFGIVGAIWGHLLLGYNLSFISIFGIVALSGVVINGSVVLVDYYNRLVARGHTVRDAMAEAVARRFRPILLTTMTTSLGLLPMLLETSLQARFLIPMAISLACGLIFATSIILFLVPMLISIFEDLKFAWRRRMLKHS
jgi:multidrug efflux pump subunit AcrB